MWCIRAVACLGQFTLNTPCHGKTMPQSDTVDPNLRHHCPIFKLTACTSEKQTKHSFPCLQHRAVNSHNSCSPFNHQNKTEIITCFLPHSTLTLLPLCCKVINQQLCVSVPSYWPNLLCQALRHALSNVNSWHTSYHILHCSTSGVDLALMYCNVLPLKHLY